MTVTEYNQCVDSYSDSLYRFILKHIKDVDVAKDIVQDTFEKVWRKVNDVESTNAKYKTKLELPEQNALIA